MGKTILLLIAMVLASQAYGAISALVSTTTPAPNGAGHFVSLGTPSSYDGPIVAVGLSVQAETDTGRRGIYSLALPIAVDADTSMFMPGFNQSFGSFSSESGSFSPAFRGFGTDGAASAVYVSSDGTILLIAKPGDVVNGL